MDKRLISAALTFIMGIAVGFGVACLVKKTRCGHGHGTINKPHCALRRGMEKLWAEHVLWERQFIVSSIGNLPDVESASQRLLKNQDDIGAAFTPFYGKETGAHVTSLLKEHITIAGEIVKSTLAKEDQKAQDAKKRWFENATEIAQFLSKINPVWSEHSLKAMFDDHLKMGGQILELRIKKDWKGDIANFDKMLNQALMMAKDFADGIAKQFPHKF